MSCNTKIFGFLLAAAFLIFSGAYADTYYKVQDGDTLETIAARYRVEVSSLAAVNKLEERDMRAVSPGQKLLIPRTSEADVSMPTEQKSASVTPAKRATVPSVSNSTMPAGQQIYTPLTARGSAPSQTIVISAGKSKVLLVKGLQRVAVANPDVLDLIVLSEQELILNAKVPGETVLHIWEKSGRSSHIVKVVADIAELVSCFNTVDALSGVSIQILRNTVLLTGAVDDKAVADAAVVLAKSSGLEVVSFIKINEKPAKPVMSVTEQVRLITNDKVKAEVIEDKVKLTGKTTSEEHARLLKAAAGFGKVIVDEIVIEALPQVRVELKVLEIDKEQLRKTGVKWNDALNFGELSIGGPFERTDKFVAALNILVEETPYARILSSPSLVTVSGKNASFLVGGEVPVPITTITDGKATQSIIWKNFGIELQIAPIIKTDGSIDMEIVSDVSDIDRVNGTTVEGAFIPAFSKRTAKTFVRLHDEETLAIGGLMSQHDTQKITKVPFLGDIPIIGNLFKSTEFNKGETELVVLIKPVLLKDTATQIKNSEKS